MRNRGEKGLTSDDADHVFFKLDAKLVLVYDDTEYPVPCVEFAPYSGQKKFKMDRSKLLVEAKTIYNQVMDMDISEENKDLLRITNIQIIGKIGIYSSFYYMTKSLTCHYFRSRSSCSVSKHCW